MPDLDSTTLPASTPTLGFLGSDAPDPPVTVIRDIHARPGAEAQFESLMSALIKEATRQPGHLGATVVRPHAPGAPYRFVYKFDRRSNLIAWHDSDLRARLMNPIRDLIATDRFSEYPGLETWFNLPAGSTPPKWKTTLMSWAAIYILVTAASYGLEAIGFRAPLPIRSLLLTAIVVPLVAYVVGPMLGRLLHGWLHAPRTP